MIHSITTSAPPTAQPKAPSVGQLMSVYGQACRVTRVYPFGTCDVLTCDGSRAYRVTGLGWIGAKS